MTALAYGLGLVLVIEGLVLALLPGRLDDILRTLARMPPDSRRVAGLGALALGVILVWLAGPT
jgi:uncharacterized protein YjeT (DUF2065 family)